MTDNRHNEKLKTELLHEGYTDLEFAVFGDSRPTSNSYYWETIKRLRSRFRFWVNVGDFTEWSAPWEYSRYIARLNDVGISSFHVIGNHDNRLFGNWCFKKYFGHWNMSINYGTWKLILFRNVYVLGYGISYGTYRWLRRELQEADAKRQKVCLFTHVPPKHVFNGVVDFDKSKMLDDRRFYELLKRYKNTIRLCFYGHAHLYASVFDGAWHTISGGAALPEDLHQCSYKPSLSYSIQHVTSVILNQDGSFKTRVLDLNGDEVKRFEYIGDDI